MVGWARDRAHWAVIGPVKFKAIWAFCCKKHRGGGAEACRRAKAFARKQQRARRPGVPLRGRKGAAKGGEGRSQ